jgi:hypothetical protein
MVSIAERMMLATSYRRISAVRNWVTFATVAGELRQRNAKGGPAVEVAALFEALS